MEAESIRKPVVYREPSGEEAVYSPVDPTAKLVGEEEAVAYLEPDDLFLGHITSNDRENYGDLLPNSIESLGELF